MTQILEKPVAVDRELSFLSKYYFYDKSLVRETEPVFLLIGAYTKRIINYMLRDYPTAKIIVYEAESTIFEEFNALKFEGNVTFVNRALNKQNAPVQMHKYSDEEASSVFQIGRKKPKRVSQVEGRTLESILSDNKIDKLDLLLMNCEGGELFALDEIISKSNVRSKISQICTCYHADHARVYPKSEEDRLHSSMSITHNVYDHHPRKVQYFLYSPKA